MIRSQLPGLGEGLLYGRRTAREEQPRRQRGSRIHNLPVVVFLIFRPPADGRVVAVACGQQRPDRDPACSGAWGVAAKHGALGTSVGRGIQNFPVHGARFCPRGGPVSARDPAHGTGDRARARAWLCRELSRGWLLGPGTAPLPWKRSRARYGSTPRRKGRGKRADDVRPYPYELASRGGYGRRPHPARGLRGIFPVRREGLVFGPGLLP